MYLVSCYYLLVFDDHYFDVSFYFAMFVVNFHSSYILNNHHFINCNKQGIEYPFTHVHRMYVHV